MSGRGRGELKEENKGTADIWVTPATAGRNDKWIQQKCFISTSIVKSNYWLKLEVLPWSWPWINKNMFEFQQMSLNFTYLSLLEKEKKDLASPFVHGHPHLRHRHLLQKWVPEPKKMKTKSDFLNFLSACGSHWNCIQTWQDGVGLWKLFFLAPYTSLPPCTTRDWLRVLCYYVSSLPATPFSSCGDRVLPA